TVGEGKLMTHDEPCSMAPDDKHDLISGTCSHLPKENAELENDHKTKGNDFKNSYNDKKEHQTRLPGADSTKELLDKATKLENEKPKG
ncbi:MAG: hypothetical protein E7I11_01910, partial [Klebsiella michiganensis]|nr:hypothetical protein [Klebsiella michiganensis]